MPTYTKMPSRKQRKFMSDPLYSLLTISEVSLAFGKHRTTVQYHVDRGHFVFRRDSQGRYLILRESVFAYYARLHSVVTPLQTS